LSTELVINSSPEKVRIALLKNKELVECHFEDKESEFNVGDFYLGKVRKVVDGLNAAFVDVGYEKDAFLHYTDLGPNIKSLSKYVKTTLNKKNNTGLLNGFQFEPQIDKLGKISQVLTKNQKVLVQITKEPISSKGPRLSCELSLAGRYLVLVPFSKTISVSRKINDAEERKRLKRLITSIRPENFGVIIRTVAQGKDVAELDKDLKSMVDKWQQARKTLKTSEPPTQVLGEVERSSALVRDLLNESFDAITIDDQEAYEGLRDYISEIAPDKVDLIKKYNGKGKLFEARGIEHQLKTLFGQSVSLPGGGYLIIEHTEALHVVDVNSGNKATKEENQETTALNVNILAVAEVARQLRLRDMGGIIVLDLIDMKKAENRKQVYDRMRELMKVDKAKSVILPLSKFGLMQITRQRVRPELNISTGEVCPTCSGSGKIAASLQIADVIEGHIDHLFIKQNEKSLTLTVHPFLYAYYTKGLFSKKFKWWWEYKKKVNLIQDSSLGIVDFSIFNSQGEEIEFK
jgi:ribonuclease G